MADDPIRAFIAVPVPPPLRASISSAVHVLRAVPGGERVRWVPPENLHVTLRFLGNIERSLVPTLLDAIRPEVARHTAFEVRLGPVALFPPGRRPHVVALEMQPTEPLVALAASVEHAVQELGLPAKERAFRAHLTLGRMRDRKKPFAVTGSDTTLSDPLPVTEAILFQSELRSQDRSRNSALHTPLGQAALGAGRGGHASPLI